MRIPKHQSCAEITTIQLRINRVAEMPSENPTFQQLLFIEMNCHVTIEGTQHGLIICLEQHTEIAKRTV